MKALNVFFILLFLFSAAVQYNDPDPYIWMPLYLYGALLCFFAFRKQFSLMLYLLGMSVYVAYAGILFFSETGVLSWINEHQAESIVQTMQADKPWIEETREFFGLVLLIAALGINLTWLLRTKKNAVSVAK
jgi:hypothetical protein